MPKTIWIASILLLGIAVGLPGCSESQQSKCQKLLHDPVRLSNATLFKVLKCEPQFSTLVKAIRVAGLKDTFLERGAYYTFFAPTNAAFAKLPKATLAMWMRHKSRESLRHILFYHAIPEAIVIKGSHKTLAMQTAAGEKSTLKIRDGKIIGINTAQVVSPPTMVANAAIYPIDQVLLPPPGNP